MNHTCEHFGKMQMIFKARTGSFGHASWWERTVLCSMETVIWSRSGGQSIGSGKGILPRYAKVPYGYLAEKTSQDSDQLHCFCGRQIISLTCTGPHFLSHQGAW